MNALTRHRSHGMLDDLFREFTRDMAPGFFVQPLHGDPIPSEIRIDIEERDGVFEVQAEIPGVKKEDIHVDLDGNVLSLQAEIRQEDTQASEGRTVRKERYYGSVARTVQLPGEIDESKAKARYENGVLKLELPKKDGGRPQRLTID